MSNKNLTPLQMEVLSKLSDIRPPWTLTGGAALILALGHRQTRDLDLRWSSLESIGSMSRLVRDTLISHGFSVSTIQSGHTFARLRVERGGDSVDVDLIAEPSPGVEPPIRIDLREETILVDTLHTTLVHKLCSLLGRAELRDLVDVKHLLAAGGDLDRALNDAPRYDSGFSPLTLAWVLEGLPAIRLARALGWSQQATADLDEYRKWLIDTITSTSAPE